MSFLFVVVILCRCSLKGYFIAFPERSNKRSNNITTMNEEQPRHDDLNLVNLPETVGGSQTRKYLNQNVVPHLLNGMRLIATEVQDPLRVLGEYLIKQSESSKN